MSVRPVVRSWQARPTMEGAGVRLNRVFGSAQFAAALDPFLLLDFFSSDDPADFIAGFPWHPHRGIETITYLHHGRVAHGDSLGNKGVIGPGDVQWMTAGSGIVHQEMPERGDGKIRGFQLWANLPARDKMMAPRYRDVPAATIPAVQVGAAAVSVIAGTIGGVAGPVADIVTAPFYFDVTLPAGAEFAHAVPAGHTVFAFVYEGGAAFGAGDEAAAALTCVLFGDGETVTARAGAGGAGFILVGGMPLREPIAWYGPIVMNTQAELDTAFREYEEGTFIKG